MRSPRLVVALVLLVGVRATAADEPKVKLLAAGKGDKRVLRLSAPAGKERFVIKETLAKEIDAGGAKVSGSTLISSITCDIELGAADDAGARAVDVKISDVSLKDPDASGATEAKLHLAAGELSGTTGHSRVSAENVLDALAIDKLEHAPPFTGDLLSGIDETLHNVVLPFPEEPVGVGARWQVIRDLQLYGMNVRRTFTYSLDSLSDTGGTVTMTIDEAVDPDAKPNLPGTSPDLTVKLLGSKGHGDGKIQFSTTRMSWSKGSARLKMRIDVRVTEHGRPTDASVVTNASLTIEPR